MRLGETTSNKDTIEAKVAALETDGCLTVGEVVIVTKTHRGWVMTLAYVILGLEITKYMYVQDREFTSTRFSRVLVKPAAIAHGETNCIIPVPFPPRLQG
jgi:hypothetical protein